MVLDFEQFVIRHLARGIGPYGFEDVLDRDVMAAMPAGKNRAPIENHSRDIETKQRHRRARDRLVAGDQRDDAVEHVPARHELDGIGDHLAAHQ